MRMPCGQFARSGEIIEGSPADKTWLKFNFEIIPPAFKIPWKYRITYVSKSLETIVLLLRYHPIKVLSYLQQHS